MKQLTFVILEDEYISDKIIRELNEAGINGTLIPTMSLKHVVEESTTSSIFLSLSKLHINERKDNTTIMILAEKEKAKEISRIVKKLTKEFTLVKGAIISLPVEYYEGSF